MLGKTWRAVLERSRGCWNCSWMGLDGEVVCPAGDVRGRELTAHKGTIRPPDG